MELNRAIEIMKQVIGTRITGTGVELAQIQQAFDVILSEVENKNGNDAIPVSGAIQSGK